MLWGTRWGEPFLSFCAPLNPSGCNVALDIVGTLVPRDWCCRGRGGEGCFCPPLPTSRGGWGDEAGPAVLVLACFEDMKGKALWNGRVGCGSFCIHGRQFIGPLVHFALLTDEAPWWCPVPTVLQPHHFGHCM